MLRKMLGLVAILGISSILVGCGADCQSTCEDGQEDGDCFDQLDGDKIDCESYCEAVEDVAAEDNADCEDKLDEYIDCLNDSDHICDAATDECDDEGDDLTQCIVEFCTEHSSNDSCEAIVDAAS